MARNTQQDNTQQQRLIAVIGPRSRRVFLPFLQEILQVNARVRTFEDIRSALDEVQTLQQADLTIVLQTWSDQYSPEEVNELVGVTLFRRLMCCYTVACESDGRNRNIWPDSVRVPLRLAASYFRREWNHVLAGREDLLPTASRDEVFAYRAGLSEDWRLPPAAGNLRCLVISPDRPLRQTIEKAIRTFGPQASGARLLGDRADVASSVPPAEPDLVIHDLDPWCSVTEKSVDVVRDLWPQADLFGLATMPDGGLTVEIADHFFVSVIPKLDLVDGLLWHLQLARCVAALPARVV